MSTSSNSPINTSRVTQNTSVNISRQQPGSALLATTGKVTAFFNSLASVFASLAARMRAGATAIFYRRSYTKRAAEQDQMAESFEQSALLSDAEKPKLAADYRLIAALERLEAATYRLIVSKNKNIDQVKFEIAQENALAAQQEQLATDTENPLEVASHKLIAAKHRKNSAILKLGITDDAEEKAIASTNLQAARETYKEAKTHKLSLMPDSNEKVALKLEIDEENSLDEILARLQSMQDLES